MFHLLLNHAKKAPFQPARPSYLYISCGRLTAPACVEAVLLNGGLVANWLLLQSGLWLCPWVIRGLLRGSHLSIASEPVKECRLGADQRGKAPPETLKSQKGNGRVKRLRSQGGDAGKEEKETDSLYL